MTSPPSRRAHVVGLGLIGGSLALALGDRGWHVTGEDSPDVHADAIARGVVEEGAFDDAVALAIVATPAGAVGEVARRLLAASSNDRLVVTDVAGVKTAIVAEVTDGRFIGGHPMAGSEQRGLAAARGDLFRGCTWVLTPTDRTGPDAYGTLHGYLRELDANVVAVSPEDHDRLVAIASHVPHLVAGALMNEASRVAEEDAILLQLAAGGFRDMTRVAAGDPSIWPDVLFENHAAIDDALGRLVGRLSNVRAALEAHDDDVVRRELTTASDARRQLPGRALSSENLAYLRVRVSDRPGVLAAVTRAASEQLVNIYDIEIAHGIEGTEGTLLLAVEAERAGEFADHLRELGFTVGRE